MVRTRTVVLALFVAAGAIALAIGTGAFSTVAADRTVDVQTAGDDGALLQLTVHSGPNGLYAEQTAAGQLQILLDGSGASSASGVNLNASTTIQNVFNITNQGSQPVGVWIEKSGPNNGLVTFETAGSAQLDNTSAASQTLAVGDTIEVTITIDTTGQNLAAGDVILESITIHADADLA